MQDASLPPSSGRLDAVIKVLTIFKLLLQLAFYGLLVGMTLWFLLENPLPELIQKLQDQVVSSFVQDAR